MRRIERHEDVYNVNIHDNLTNMGYERLRITEAYVEKQGAVYIVPIPPLDWYGGKDGSIVTITPEGRFNSFGLDLTDTPEDFSQVKASPN